MQTHIYRTQLTPPGMPPELIELSADRNTLPVLDVTAINAQQAAATALSLSGQRVARCERMDGDLPPPPPPLSLAVFQRLPDHLKTRPAYVKALICKPEVRTGLAMADWQAVQQAMHHAELVEG